MWQEKMSGIVQRLRRVPNIIQTEAAECGLACLAGIAGYHGNNVSLRSLRDRFPVSGRGTTLKRLIEIARVLGFDCRPLRLEPSRLKDLRLPAILHWDMNHYVVLVRVRKGSFVVSDPLVGVRHLTHADVSSSFTGVALELEPSHDFERVSGEKSIRLRDLIGNVTQFGRAMGYLLGCSLAIQIFQLAGPFLMQFVLDDVLLAEDMSLLATISIGFAVLLIFHVAVTLARGWVVAYLASHVSGHWTSMLVKHLFKLPLDYFEKRQLADVVSRLGGVATIQRTISTNFVETLIDGVMALVVLTLLFAYSASLAGASIVAIAMYLLLRVATFRRLKEATHQQLVSAAKQQGHILESLRSMLTIKACGMESLRVAQWQSLQSVTLAKDAELANQKNLFAAGNMLIFGLERVIVIALAVYFVFKGNFTAGMLVAYLGYREIFVARVPSLIDHVFELQMLRLHLERLADIALSLPENESLIQVSQSLPDRRADVPAIQVEDLSFRYSKHDDHVLASCSFSIRRGESVAVVGPSGCGKTTLLKLLVGLLEPTAGTIRISGEKLNDLDPRAVRQRFGVVMQDDQLFSGTIGQNISMFDDEVGCSQLSEVAGMAGLEDMLRSLPMGIHTQVGEMGNKLSGGQKQRVILARALFRRPEILLLDEATSHLDNTNEGWINAAIRSLDITRVIVAHRSETIRSADRIIEIRGRRCFEFPLQGGDVACATGSGRVHHSS